MKTKNARSAAEKLTNLLIVGLVIFGTMLFAGITKVGEGSDLMSKIFIAFLGTIITLQVIPGLILVGAMIKEACFGNRSLEVPSGEIKVDRKGNK